MPLLRHLVATANRQARMARYPTQTAEVEEVEEGRCVEEGGEEAVTEDWKMSHSRHMRGFLWGFLLAAAGAGLAYVIDYGPPNRWSFLAAAMALVGIRLGGYHLTHARQIALDEFRKMDREAAERRAVRRRALQAEEPGTKNARPAKNL